MHFSAVWLNKHWKSRCKEYMLPATGELRNKHTHKQQIYLTFPQNIHCLFIPREKEESDREMRMSSRLVLGGSGEEGLACWLVFEVSHRPCEQPWSLHGESHRSLQAPGHYQQQQLHNKKAWKKRGRNLRCSFLMASALTSDIVKDNRHPGNCNTTWWNTERIICFYYKSRYCFFSSHFRYFSIQHYDA